MTVLEFAIQRNPLRTFVPEVVLKCEVNSRGSDLVGDSEFDGGGCWQAGTC